MMKTFTAVELYEIIEKHHSWLLGRDDGVRANLSSADLRSANLRYANLSYANLSYANLRYANLSSANLSSANLSSANLSYANLSSADLSYADLRYANLRSANLSYADLSLIGTAGNMSEIKSIQCDYWPVTYTFDRMQIGCQNHLISEWFAFSDKEISRMDSMASQWWAVWKPILTSIIAASPAKEIVLEVKTDE